MHRLWVLTVRFLPSRTDLVQVEASDVPRGYRPKRPSQPNTIDHKSASIRARPKCFLQLSFSEREPKVRRNDLAKPANASPWML